MFDANLMLRSTSDGAMVVASSPYTGAAVDYGEADTKPLTYIVRSPAVSGTTPTLDVKLQCSTNGTTGWRDFAFFGRMTAAGFQNVTVRCQERYRRYYATLTGTLADFGAVEIGADVAGANRGY